MDFWKVKRWLRLHLGECNKYHLLRYHLNKNQANKAMVKYIGNQSKDSYVLSKMKEAWVKYHWGFDEFFYFDYLNLSNEERRSFVPEYEKNIFCSRVNNPEQAIIFYNKWKTYCKFKDFYKRDAVYVRGVPDLKREDVLDFVNKYSSFIMKPVEAACGRGIKIVKESNTKSAMKKLNDILLEAPTNYIIEQLICQVSEMASFHENSVNTVRITTINYGDYIDIIHPFMRTGQGGAYVDNGGAGGILAAICPESGRVIAACDESPRWYEIHPDSKLPLVGFKVPYWEEALKTARNLAAILPNVKYIGWDLALTDKGWVMVEGNDYGAFVGFQLPTRRGFREEFETIKERLYKINK